MSDEAEATRCPVTYASENAMTACTTLHDSRISRFVRAAWSKAKSSRKPALRYAQKSYVVNGNCCFSIPHLRL
jgi:hypothetical protein